VIYRTPRVAGRLADEIRELDELRARLQRDVSRPDRWMGTLRRQARAEAAAGSTAVEGFDVPADEALALTSPGALETPREAALAERVAEVEDRAAVASYARAMDHVAVMAGDPGFRWLDRVVLDLHFDAMHYDPARHPGRWREGPVAVTAPEGGGLAYVGPDAGEVAGLMAEVIEWLETGDAGAHHVVRAAMAHLHVISVHPFGDGNGRVSRLVQSLLLGLGGAPAIEFASIEPYLAAHTGAYYAALAEAQGGRYQPERDATAWVEFCVRAHLAQARERLAQVDRAGRRWAYLEEVVEDRAWPDRLVIALEQALVGGSDRARYCLEAGVSTATASNDFRRLLDAGLVDREGRGPETRYVANAGLRAGVAIRLGEAAEDGGSA
jgi:Fic family protein